MRKAAQPRFLARLGPFRLWLGVRVSVVIGLGFRIALGYRVGVRVIGLGFRIGLGYRVGVRVIGLGFRRGLGYRVGVSYRVKVGS